MKNIKFLGIVLLACGLLFVSCKKDKQFTITVNANNTAWGTVTGGGTYTENASATLTATANEGYKFVGWQDGNTDNPRTITVTQNATYTATFEASTPTPPPTDGISITFGDETWTTNYFFVDQYNLASWGLLTVWIQKTSVEYPRFMGYISNHTGTFTYVTDLNAMMYMDNEDDTDVTGNPIWQPEEMTTNITAIDFDTKTITATITGTLIKQNTDAEKSLNIVFNNATWTPADVTAKSLPFKKF
ncbi:MAG: hypothetical protein MJZ46_00715 [Bacteroidales bacterium]|nr:hypothetical protein [Bacteroidales bacterium]